MTAKQFNRLSPANQRITLAKDVLLQLKIGKFDATHNGYIGGRKLDSWRHDYSPHAPAKETLQSVDVCEVCAKGALVCSYVLKHNHVSVHQMRTTASENPELIAIFGRSLWNVLEALYEGWDFNLNGVARIYPLNGRTDTEGNRVYNVSGKRHSLESLMQNIIRNNGKLNYNGVIIG
jgi:hypothetical protein